MQTCKFSTTEFNKMQMKAQITKLDKMIEILKRDKEKYLLVVFLLALILDPQFAYADSITKYGNNLLFKIQIYMGIIASIMCSIELATELVKGGRGYFQILFKYGSGYVALILCPTVFKVIADLF